MADCITDTLKCIQTAIENMLSEDVIVQRYSRSPDPFGGATALYTPAGTVSGWVINSGRAAESAAGGQVVSFAPFTILMPHDGTVYPQDRLKCGDYTYEVLGTNAGATHKTTLQAYCVRLDP